MTEPVEWFVQMSLGPQPGPMSRRDLEELTRSGAVLKTNKVSQGEHGHWWPASELRGLFASESELNTGPGKTVSDTGSDATADAVPLQREEPEQHELDEDLTAGRSEGDVVGTPLEISEEAAEVDALLSSPQKSSRENDKECFELNLPEPSRSPPSDETGTVGESDEETEPEGLLSAVGDSAPRESPSPLSMPPPFSSEMMPKPLSDLQQRRPFRRCLRRSLWQGVSQGGCHEPSDSPQF